MSETNGSDRNVYVKTHPGAPTGFFECEAAGLQWLKEAESSGGATVADVLEVSRTSLKLQRFEPSKPSTAKAREFGAKLAHSHGAGAAGWGAAPDTWPHKKGFFGPLDDPREMALVAEDTFGEFWVKHRVEPCLRQLKNVYTNREFAAFDRVIERLLDGEFNTDDAPARLHGDLWWGNIIWTNDEAVLIDPAAHGGSREEDLAMLTLFGNSSVTNEIIAGYESVHPLPGRAEREGIHQLYGVLMHAVLFGGGYAQQAYSLARRYL